MPLSSPVPISPTTCNKANRFRLRLTALPRNSLDGKRKSSFSVTKAVPVLCVLRRVANSSNLRLRGSRSVAETLRRRSSAEGEKHTHPRLLTEETRHLIGGETQGKKKIAALSPKRTMPRPALPPTPGSSSDIRGKDGMQQLSSLQLAFELPPPAIHDAAADASRISPVDSKQQQLSPLSTPSLGLDVATSPKTVVYPMQAAETVKSRRRSSAATKEPKENTFALPPPPTRSRKIIQMKPRTQDTAAASASTKESARAAGKAAAAKTAAPGPDAGAGAGGASAKGESTTKKKQPSATSAAGRKIARKTAHSLIERRRRSKMNEEFALLKSMIPACTGEMHKLAILQVCFPPPP